MKIQLFGVVFTVQLLMENLCPINYIKNILFKRRKNKEEEGGNPEQQTL